MDDNIIEYENHNDLSEVTPWLSPNGRCLNIARWVVKHYENTDYMECNSTVKEWVRQSKIILEKEVNEGSNTE